MSTLKKFTPKSLRRFAKRDEGSMSVEAILMFPLLTWAYVATFAFFDAFQARSVNLKATFTVADMISRELNTVDADYIDGLLKLFNSLADSADEETWLRITSIRCVSDCDIGDENPRVLSNEWSYATGSTPALTQETLMSFDGAIPVMPEDDYVLMIETNMSYQPTFNVGLPVLEMNEIAVTRSRFVPRLCWESCNS
ncbi:MULTISPECIES: TadE/TadG family type IV pilus assembly protein [Halocynthiibacter]|uniref:Pilus assembly protein n=1 Tax=Halocynthiibacter halioticoli TaxID=2986804 RepID=A0AAE3J1N2_9RHOB|nr:MULTISPECIES: hypothetical protein [Halocynthiibacter]MCV6824946.1 hypothetical protein [Halocynthiibacter halioticoli]MCW4057947.1 hypothetical protein [Halocynthiibacter sp. SDUM655004]